MAAFALTWDWNVPPDIECQSSPMQVVSPEPQIPDMQAGKTASNEADRLAASLQNEEDVVLQKQKQKQVEEYKEKRLVIQTTPEEVAKLNSYHLRNQINDRFFKMGIDKPVVATVTKSFSGLSIIVTTMPGFSADFLIQKESVWGE